VSSRFASLEEVIRDPTFPSVDLSLRRGRHIDRDDADWYSFITDVQDHLEHFYRRFGCELVSQSDGYFYLLPSGEQLIRRQLSAGEMLVGQVLALQFLDPATVQSGGLIVREQVLSRLAGLIGDRELAKALEPRRKRFEDERIVHEIIRRRVADAIRRLASLGFIQLLDEDCLRLRAPLLRFADPVRGLEDMDTALGRLIMQGELVELPSDTSGASDDPRGSLVVLEEDDEQDDEQESNPDEDGDADA
jgi:chromosome partition protein MukE